MRKLLLALALLTIATPAFAKRVIINSNLTHSYATTSDPMLGGPITMHDTVKVRANTGLVITYGAGTVVSHKTGARAFGISSAHQPAFQAYINDIEAEGGIVKFMGGFRRGTCSPRHMHSCSAAIDVCQRSRDRVDPSCHLPPRQRLAEIAARHGLFEGGQWCNGDYGHAQAGVSAPACGSRLASRQGARGHRYASRAHRHPVRWAARHHRRYVAAR